MHCVDTFMLHRVCMSPALNNRSSALLRFECSNAIEIHNGKMYLGLAHMEIPQLLWHVKH